MFIARDSMGKRKSGEADDSVTFEASLEELEQIVVRLEGGQLGLADSLAAYERGVKRLKGCYEMLTAAERRIELVQGVDADGRVKSAPLDDADSADLADKSASRSRRRTARLDDDGGLF
jgi:exodeoxyribonuclease VII small subunit